MLQNGLTYLQRPSRAPRPLQASKKDGAPTETSYPAYHALQTVTSHSAANVISRYPRRSGL